MRFKLISFDMDGTLIDSDMAKYKALNSVLPSEKKMEYKWFLDMFYGSRRWADVLHQDLDITDKDAERIIKEWYKSYCNTFWKEIKLYPGAKEELYELKKMGVKLAVMSAGRSVKFCETELEYLGIRNLFETINSEEAWGNWREVRTRLIWGIINRLGVKPDDAAHVGDFPTDVISAKDAGVASIALKTGAGRYYDFKKVKPDFIVRAVGSGEILEITKG